MTGEDATNSLLPAGFREALRDLHRDLAADLAALAPVCAISGRCCRFEEYGHTLFLGAVEAQILVDESPPPSRPLDRGATCPWQDGAGRCTARDARPLGCRVYFCDPAFEGHAPALSETYLARLKTLVNAHGLPWNYAPLHRHLGQFPALAAPPKPAQPGDSGA